MEFQIAVMSMLVILYIIAIITVCLLVYMCLKLEFNNRSHRNINTNSDNQEESTETRNNI